MIDTVFFIQSLPVNSRRMEGVNINVKIRMIKLFVRVMLALNSTMTTKTVKKVRNWLLSCCYFCLVLSFDNTAVHIRSKLSYLVWWKYLFKCFDKFYSLRVSASVFCQWMCLCVCVTVCRCVCVFYRGSPYFRKHVNWIVHLFFISVKEIKIISAVQSSELKKNYCETTKDKGLCGPGKAYDGHMETSSVTDYDGLDGWWNATLEHESNLDRIEIYISQFRGYVLRVCIKRII